MMIAYLALIVAINSITFNFTQIIQNIQQPLYAKQITMGRTVKDNPLNVYFITKIKFQNISELYGKNAILIDSLMHAREPYSIQLMSTLFQSIIKQGDKQDLDYFLKNGVFIFYPFVNADGFQIILKNGLENNDEVRKNFNTNNIKCQSGLAGVDINRNFPSNFGSVSTSSNPCSQQYHGVAPFSQKEAIVFKDIYQNFRVLIAIDIHSYGNDWIYPYASDKTGQKVKRHKLYPFYERIKKEFEDRRRRILSCIESLGYIADGVYIDWALDNNALSFAFEVGHTFRSDTQASISQNINKAISDFYLIFKLTALDYVASVSTDQLIIQSKSLANMTLIINIQGQIFQKQLESGSKITLNINNQSNYTKITIKETEEIKIVSLQNGSKTKSFLVVVIIFIALSSLIVNLYTRYKKLKKATIDENKNTAISLDEISTINDQSQI